MMLFRKKSTRKASPVVDERVAPAATWHTAGEPWHVEARVQATLVRSLMAQGWTIERVANTATGERGVDVRARRRQETLLVEVKGYPSTTYARGPKAGQPKPTQPTLQAGHYFDGGLRMCLQLRETDRAAHVVLALPDIPRYRKLTSSVQSSLTATRVEVWFVDEQGAITSATS